MNVFTKLARNYIDKHNFINISENDEINIASAIVDNKVNKLVAKCIIYESPDLILDPIFKENNINYEDFTYNSDKSKLLLDLLEIPFKTFIEYIVKSHNVINSYCLKYLSFGHNVDLSSEMLINWLKNSSMDEIFETLKYYNDIIYRISSNLKDPEILINYLEQTYADQTSFDLFISKLSNLIDELNKIKNIRSIEYDLNEMEDKFAKLGRIEIKPYYLPDNYIWYYGNMKYSILSHKQVGLDKIYFIPINASIVERVNDTIICDKINDLSNVVEPIDFIGLDNEKDINGYVWRNSCALKMLMKQQSCSNF